jgi:uncharacterized membrane protein
MKQKLIRFAGYSTLVSLLGGLVASGVAYAAQQSAAPTIVSSVSLLGTDLFCPIIDWMFWILISLAIIMVMWAAYTYLTAGDDTEKVHRATKILTYAALAVGVALVAKGFPTLVMSVFQQGGQSSPLVCS